LQPYDIEHVEQSFARLIRESKFEPKPADAISILEEGKQALWMTADEAWSVAWLSADEERSLFVTDAVMEVRNMHIELIRSDKVAGRMAFKGGYERLMTQWKQIGRIPVVSFNGGWNAAERKEAVEGALSMGAITHEQAKAYLPPKQATGADILRIASDGARAGNHVAKEALQGMKKLLGLDGGIAFDKKFLPKPDRIFDQDGKTMVAFGADVYALDALPAR